MTANVIVTGATGMVGEGVLHECLQHPSVERIRVVSRKSCGITHPKLSELLIADFFDLAPVADQLMGYNACFFCMGVSSVGMSEAEYRKITHTLTLNMATLLSERNPGMTFCYVSGAGTDSSEQGRSMWARVKGKTENDLMALPFRQVYTFRPGYIQPTPGLRNTLRFYNYIGWLYPALRAIASGYVLTMKELSLAMIHAVNTEGQKRVLEVRDIQALAKRNGNVQ
jgi:uncharacterized protein YbjT (DUF2867 family)